jgi:alpha-galactosidase
MSTDIEPTWSSIMSITNINSFHLNATDFWGHNDADMLEVGNGNLTYAETRTHFALWAIMKSPLLIGTDITKLSQTSLALLKHPNLLKFNQDPAFGQPAMPYKWGTNPDWTFNATWPAEYWSGESSYGKLVLMINPSNDTTQVVRASWNEIPNLKDKGHKGFMAMNGWSLEQYGCNGGYEESVAPHDSALLLLGAGCDPA